MGTWLGIIGLALMFMILSLILYLIRFLQEMRTLAEDTKQLVGLEMKLDPGFPAFTDLAITVWKLSKVVDRLDEKLEGNDSRQLKSILGKFKLFLDKNDIEYKDYQGRLYNPGMNVDILNYESRDDIQSEVIYDTHMPEIRYKGIVQQSSKVIVHRPAPTITDEIAAPCIEGATTADREININDCVREIGQDVISAADN